MVHGAASTRRDQPTMIARYKPSSPSISDAFCFFKRPKGQYRCEIANTLSASLHMHVCEVLCMCEMTDELASSHDRRFFRSAEILFRSAENYSEVRRIVPQCGEFSEVRRIFRSAENSSEVRRIFRSAEIFPKCGEFSEVRRIFRSSEIFPKCGDFSEVRRFFRSAEIFR